MKHVTFYKSFSLSVVFILSLIQPVKAQNGCELYYSNSEINHILKKDSFLYITTESNLIRYNTINEESLTLPNPNNRPIYDYYDQSFAVSNNHEVFLCDDNQLLVLRNGHWDTLKKGKGYFQAVTIDTTGRIWTYGIGTIYQFSAACVLEQTISKWDFGPYETIFGMVYFDNTLWIAKPDALYSYDGDTVIAINEKNSNFPTGQSIAIYADKDTLIYCGVKLNIDGSWKSNFCGVYANKQWTVMDNGQFSPQSGIVRSIAVEGNLWYFFCDDGAYRYDRISFVKITPSGLPKNNLFTQGLMCNGSLYGGTDFFGLQRLGIDSVEWHPVMISNQNLPGKMVEAFGKEMNGTLWVSSWSISRYRGWAYYFLSWKGNTDGFWQNMVDSISDKPGYCHTILNGPGNSVYFINDKALHVLKDSQWSKFTADLKGLKQAALDIDSNLWVSTADRDINMWDGNDWTQSDPCDLSFDYAYALGFSPNGSRWFGTSHGKIIELHDTSYINHNLMTPSLGNNMVFDLTFCPKDSSMLFGGAGVLKLKNKIWTQAQTYPNPNNSNGLQAETITDIEYDPLTRNVWYAGVGVLMQDTQNNWFRFTTDNSCLPSNQISVIRHYGQELWLATASGLVNFTIPVNKIPIKTALKNLRISAAIKSEPSILAYPNPADKVIYTSLGENVSYTITDVAGKVIGSGSGSAIPVGDIDSGIYILTLDYKQAHYSIKICVSHP